MDSDFLLDANQAFRQRYGGGSPFQVLVADLLSYRFKAWTC